MNARVDTMTAAAGAALETRVCALCKAVGVSCRRGVCPARLVLVQHICDEADSAQLPLLAVVQGCALKLLQNVCSSLSKLPAGCSGTALHSVEYNSRCTAATVCVFTSLSHSVLLSDGSSHRAETQLLKGSCSALNAACNAVNCLLAYP
jgi:hypothetical protein